MLAARKISTENSELAPPIFLSGKPSAYLSILCIYPITSNSNSTNDSVVLESGSSSSTNNSTTSSTSGSDDMILDYLKSFRESVDTRLRAIEGVVGENARRLERLEQMMATMTPNPMNSI